MGRDVTRRAASVPMSTPDLDGRRYEHISALISGTVWAIEPNTLGTMIAILAERRSGHRPSATEIRARIDQARSSRPHKRSQDPTITPTGVTPTGVAVIPISGPIVPHGGSIEELSSGATSVEAIAASFRQALASTDVASIVLDFDSPGGSVDLIPELAAEIYAARGSKPIVAVADTWAASAAYWLASAADELVVTPSGQVGSIGVYSAHEDLSARMMAEGIKTTLVSAGDYKVEGNPFEPLGKEAEAEIQAHVDAYYEMFVSAVAAQRGVSKQLVEDTFGQGRMVMAADAVVLGMADRIGTLEEVVAGLQEASAPAREPSLILSEVTSSSSTPRIDVAVRAGSPPRHHARGQRYAEIRRETRTGGPVEQLRSTGGGDHAFRGYASTFGVPYVVEDWLGEYEEEFVYGAWTKTLREGDVPLLIEHEGLPLARTSSGTLVLTQDPVGLLNEATLLHTDPDVMRIVPKMNRHDLTNMSVAFRVPPGGQSWNEDFTYRKVSESVLFDTSIVTSAANPGALAGLRSIDVLRRFTELDPAELMTSVRDAQGFALLIEARSVLDALEDRPRRVRDSASTMHVDIARRQVELAKLGVTPLGRAAR
jgi:HK97 family phage prohead protease